MKRAGESRTRQNADVKFLADAIKDAPPPGPEPVEKIVAACKEARRKMPKEKWGEKSRRLFSTAASLSP